MLHLPLEMVISVCKELSKEDLLNVICSCKFMCENKNIIIFEWIKHTKQVGVFFKLPLVCDSILASRNITLVNEMFIYAAFIGRTDIVKSCLAIGADPNHRSGEALVLAARFGYMEIVELLLESGVDVHSKDDEALMCSIANDHDDIAKRLVQVGSIVNSPAIEKGFYLRRWMFYYGTCEIEPWHHNMFPPNKPRTIIEKIVSVVCKLFNI